MKNQFVVGDKVQHKKDLGRIGTIKIIEDNELSVMILWEDWENCEGLEENYYDFQWINKIELVTK